MLIDETPSNSNDDLEEGSGKQRRQKGPREFGKSGLGKCILTGEARPSMGKQRDLGSDGRGKAVLLAGGETTDEESCADYRPAGPDDESELDFAAGVIAGSHVAAGDSPGASSLNWAQPMTPEPPSEAAAKEDSVVDWIVERSPSINSVVTSDVSQIVRRVEEEKKANAGKPMLLEDFSNRKGKPVAERRPQPPRARSRASLEAARLIQRGIEAGQQLALLGRSALRGEKGLSEGTGAGAQILIDTLDWEDSTLHKSNALDCPQADALDWDDTTALQAATGMMNAGKVLEGLEEGGVGEGPRGMAQLRDLQMDESMEKLSLRDLQLDESMEQSTEQGMQKSAKQGMQQSADSSAGAPKRLDGPVDLLLGNLIPKGLVDRLRGLERLGREQRGVDEMSTTGTEVEGDRWGTEASCSPQALRSRELALAEATKLKSEREAKLLAHPNSDWFQQF